MINRRRPGVFSLLADGDIYRTDRERALGRLPRRALQAAGRALLPAGRDRSGAPLYGDAACTREVFATTPGCVPASGYAVSERFSSLQPPLPTRLFRVLGPMNGPAFDKESGTCAPTAYPEEKALLQVEEIPLDSLAPVRGRTDE
jgi:hypothetical protein